MKTSQLAQKLFRTIFQSATADEYCKNLVHSVLNDTTVRGAGLFVLTADSSLKAVGHYGLAEDMGTLEYANVWDSNPLSLAVKQGRAIIAPPPPQIGVSLTRLTIDQCAATAVFALLFGLPIL